MGLSSRRFSRPLLASARPLAVALSLAGALAAASSGCGDDDDDDVGARTREVTIPFAARVGDKAFACGQTYEGVGATKTTVKPLDFRLYVHDVRLVRAGGEEVPVTLTQDGTWQNGAVALLDFEDGTAGCAEGDAALNTSIRGTVPEHDDYTGIAFRFGLPTDRNHLDSATQPAPLNIPAMWWAWQSGYKYLKLDLSTAQNAAYYLHLGATTCSGSPADGFSCAYDNLPSFSRPYNLTGGSVILDVAGLYAGVDLDAQNDKTVDPITGCMSFAGDPQCGMVFEQLGLTYESNTPSTTTSSFVIVSLPD